MLPTGSAPAPIATHRRPVFVAGLSIAAVVALCAPAPAAEPGATPAASRPIIEVRDTGKDAGAVEEGTVVQYRFAVANRGQADLEISQVKPGCGCTVARWDRQIKPGQEG